MVPGPSSGGRTVRLGSRELSIWTLRGGGPGCAASASPLGTWGCGCEISSGKAGTEFQMRCQSTGFAFGSGSTSCVAGRVEGGEISAEGRGEEAAEPRGKKGEGREPAW